jgi:hypothetical protein
VIDVQDLKRARVVTVDYFEVGTRVAVRYAVGEKHEADPIALLQPLPNVASGKQLH